MGTAVLTQAQTGLSIGTHGLGLKTNPEAAWRLTARTGSVGFGADQRINLVTAQPEVFVTRSWKHIAPAYPYLGLGVKSQLTWQPSGFAHYTSLVAPVGIEVFPFKSRRISLTTEARFSWPLSNEAPRPTLGGMIELTWYLR
ncbi:MAG: hypothetical protein SF053_10345 [Bacteroidia bacterium]|nr:hypothetical protein [Bacteroidia bacterium]